jgi:hypothetical protein
MVSDRMSGNAATMRTFVMRGSYTDPPDEQTDRTASLFRALLLNAPHITRTSKRLKMPDRRIRLAGEEAKSERPTVLPAAHAAAPCRPR